MKVRFIKSWFAPNGFFYHKRAEPYEISDDFKDLLPKTSCEVIEEEVKAKPAPVKKEDVKPAPAPVIKEDVKAPSEILDKQAKELDDLLKSKTK